jgi:hypothetical protein
MVSSAATSASSATIFKSILLISEKVPSRLVSSAVLAFAVAASAGAASVVTPRDPQTPRMLLNYTSNIHI